MTRCATIRRILPAALLLGVLAALPAHAQFAQAADKVRDAVVTVQVAQQKRMGTGFIISPDGTILTNKHVLGGATGATVKLVNGDELPAKVVKTDEQWDLLVLKIERQHLPTVQFAASSKLKQGDEVAAIGAPFGLSDTLTKGVVSSVGREIEGRKYIQIDAALNQGNSGGPIINEQGQVVGVATKAALKAENMGFAIPSDDVMTFLSESGLTFTATLDAQPPETKPAGAPEGESGGPPAGGPAAPAVPAAPPASKCPLGEPWATLVAAALIAFLVALITALVVAKSASRAATSPYMPGPAYQPAPQAPGWSPDQPQAPHPPAPVQPMPPPQEDLSDIDIELR
jgi:V8-like Glu-specific endopeptidase